MAYSFQFRSAAGLSCALVWSFAGASAPATSLQETIDQEAVLVQFIAGGAPLSTEERAELAASVRKTAAADPEGVESAARDASSYLKLLDPHKPQSLTLGRELGRYEVAFGGCHALGPGEEGRTAANIVSAHDPIVIADAGKKQLVTLHTVKVLVQGNREGAVPFAVAAPGPDAEASLAATIRRRWGTTDEGMRDALAHAERYIPYSGPYLAKAIQNLGARAPFFSNVHGMIVKASAADPAMVQFSLAEVMASTGRSAQKNGGAAGMADWNDMARIHNQQALIDRAGRATMPGCGVAAGAVQSPAKSQFCNPSLLP